MRNAVLAILPIALSVLAPTAAYACRVAPQPERLQREQADAIALVQIARVGGDDAEWHAVAAVRGSLAGTMLEDEVEYDRPLIISSCDNWPPPKPGKYYVLYLRNREGGVTVTGQYPYWWARRSGDPRLSRLDELLPLGAVRQPTPDEERLIALAEPRIKLPAGSESLDDYTKIFARTSASYVSVALLRSENPQRLMADEHESFPTEPSCKCELIEVAVSLEDFYREGKLPPFAQ